MNMSNANLSSNDASKAEREREQTINTKIAQYF